MSKEEAQDAYTKGYYGNVVWGSDYPHVEGTWQLPMDESTEPQTHLSLRDSFAGIPTDIVRQMVGLNGIKVYDLDQAELQAVANRITAPTADEIANPLPNPDIPSHHGLFSFRTIGPWA
jgi:hypothetical protein